MSPLEAIKLAELINSSKPLFSKDWLRLNAALFEEENLIKLTKHLMCFYKHGISENLPLPHFSEEITPSRKISFSFFESAINTLAKSNFRNNATHKSLVSETIQKTPFEHILLIMGQRQTPATIKTAEGLPLKEQDLINSCLKPFNKQISVGVRAWEKHTDRSEDTFWGDIKGTPQQKQQKVKQICTKIIENHTWWNTFHHYKHEIVFEIRAESGHGIRWSYKDQTLIGFLEPFL